LNDAEIFSKIKPVRFSLLRPGICRHKKLLLRRGMDQNYWDKVYNDKTEKEMSWFQDHPTRSLELIAEMDLPKNARIIDVGGGDSRLVDHLLEQGFSDITVLDISQVSLKNLKDRLGDTKKVSYIQSDVVSFIPENHFDLWHDRAAFHFLTTPEQINHYLELVNSSLPSGAHLIISTFSKSGPQKCSGLPIHQYSEHELKKLFSQYFKNIKCFEDTHITPWGTTQNFVYCGFKKL
jgi:ubiquinone/menaquinone biosynthesis C-methylase UbiE